MVEADDEQTNNNMNQAMSTLNSKFLLKSHLSYYTEKTSKSLTPTEQNPSVETASPSAPSKPHDIDISKAYTSAFCDSTEIPISSEPDASTLYNGEPTEPLNFYIAKGDDHP